jgi:hypothetical protein
MNKPRWYAKAFSIIIFSIFVHMAMKLQCNANTQHVQYLLLNMSNHCTWSFPEFMPFCLNLYYFSSLKEFSAVNS